MFTEKKPLRDDIINRYNEYSTKFERKKKESTRNYQ